MLMGMRWLFPEDKFVLTEWIPTVRGMNLQAHYEPVRKTLTIEVTRRIPEVTKDIDPGDGRLLRSFTRAVTFRHCRRFTTFELSAACAGWRSLVALGIWECRRANRALTHD